MTDITAKVNSNPNLRATVTPTRNVKVTSFRLTAETFRFGDLSDINLVANSDGALLVYNENSDQWVATTTIENQNTTINGGNY